MHGKLGLLTLYNASKERKKCFSFFLSQVFVQRKDTISVEPFVNFLQLVEVAATAAVDKWASLKYALHSKECRKGQD